MLYHHLAKFSELGFDVLYMVLYSILHNFVEQRVKPKPAGNLGAILVGSGFARQSWSSLGAIMWGESLCQAIVGHSCWGSGFARQSEKKLGAKLL
jgi:hypothetical protein